MTGNEFGRDTNAVTLAPTTNLSPTLSSAEITVRAGNCTFRSLSFDVRMTGLREEGRVVTPIVTVCCKLAVLPMV